MTAAIKSLSWHKEISGLALAISLPQLISAPISVGIAKLLYSQNIVYELKEIIEFLLISFPLTFAFAMIVALAKSGELNIISLVVIILIAVSCSNLAHLLFKDAPSTDLSQTLNDPDNSGGAAFIFRWIWRLLKLYWVKFGWVLFIQSCGIGVYIGWKYAEWKGKKQ